MIVVGRNNKTPVIVSAIKTPIFEMGQDLEAFITTHLSEINEGTIIVITSKILALAQGRVVGDGPGEKERMIRAESKQVIETPWCFLAYVNGEWCASAGIDQSNANGQLILFPDDPYAVALDLWERLKKYYNIKSLGIIITDSRSMPLRLGVMGSMVGYAGFEGLKEYSGTKDLFERELHYTKVNIADSLATAAVLVMGEAAEQKPLATISEAPVTFWENRETPNRLRMKPEDDIYREVFKSDL